MDDTKKKLIAVNAATGTGVKESAFAGDKGMEKEIKRISRYIRRLYLEDEMPWIVAYSGGKDSTAVLQLVWTAIADLQKLKHVRNPKKNYLHKPIFVITNDTLVENPIVSSWVNQSLSTIAEKAAEQQLPIEPNLLTPKVTQTFWVNLIGRGYPAPNRRFRWCTERMKISPSTDFITKKTTNGAAIILLGTRKAESAARSKRITEYQRKATRDLLSPHNDIPAALTWAPIAEWTNDDVWTYLTSKANPWGYDNKNLLALYASATEDAECPVVIDTSTPSCGNSRFGCWTCTLVEKDKSMSAMITNDDEKEWMLPLLMIRDELAASGSGEKREEMRDFRRMTGVVSLHDGKEVRGPFTQVSRKYWLKRVLEAQTWVRNNGPTDMRNLELITHDELMEIRRIWVLEKHEREDLLPKIYAEATGDQLKDIENLDDEFPFNADDLAILEELTDHDLQYELLRELMSVEHSHQAKISRRGLWDDFDKAFNRSGYLSSEEAINAKKASVRSRSAAANAVEMPYEDALEEILEEIDAGITGTERT